MDCKLFSELYSSYYNAVAAILRASCDTVITPANMEKIISNLAFSDSVLEIPEALGNGSWDLMEDGKSKLQNIPTMPLTTLQKRWLKTVLNDPRITLFMDEEAFAKINRSLCDVEPLWDKDSIKIYDSYSNGDYYDDAAYRSHWQLIMRCIREGRAIEVKYISRKNHEHREVMMPVSMEYSEKNDRFRLVGYSNRGDVTVNISSIEKIEVMPSDYVIADGRNSSGRMAEVTLAIRLEDKYNSLERVMLTFAHYEREAVVRDGVCHLTIKYSASDEKEMVINVLSFGPRVKVEAPSYFAELVKEKIRRQMKSQIFFRD